MHEEKIALVRRQIEALAAAVASRNIRHVWVVACGGSLATLDPFRYILTAETDKVSAAAVNAAEFAAELPKGLGEDCLVVLNSQSGTTAETVRAAQLAKERGALTAAYTRLSQRVTQPLIASGLLTDKRDVCGALAAGAVAVSTTSEELWEA